MTEKEFNLLDENWIRVMDADCRVNEVSLKAALINAHEYVSLAGELPTQDMAVLRLLLAVLHAVFYRVDEHGENAPMRKGPDARKRWKALWDMGRLPQKPIEEYLERWRERFWLFHEERPFYQVREAAIGTEYTASKLNGELSESSNKIRLFPTRTGSSKASVEYDEAARWLLYVNAFDDTSSKPKGKDLPSIGTGWLGKLGLISAKGNNLFETLILNLVLTNDSGEIWESALPIWELEEAPCAERVRIGLPYDQAALLTLQSRRILLDRDNGKVTGFSLLGGDFFERKDAFAEQMTVWKPVYEKRELTGYQPRRHDSARSIWRDFSVIAAKSEDGVLPGIVNWHMSLQNRGLWKKTLPICYETTSVQYGDKDFFVTDVFSDSMTFSASILSELNRPWQNTVTRAIMVCDDIANTVGRLASDIVKASGGVGVADEVRAKQQYYHRIDLPFRLWLQRLDPDADDMAERLDEWKSTARDFALKLGKELIDGAGDAAMTGRVIEEGNKKIKRLYSAPNAYNWFLYNVEKKLRREVER